ncbi:uncharacterized protein EURHEDRAFT_458542 [Aspergillus ruber CBS 135680]|uniref:Mitochondrial ATPase expression-domain-containing protein n=1 Tax=Aspergillus ruber (strain CBS 135680) TaxID=1388766 RepID=A0A017SBE1_ASPRC|nr:uncharacterized protein EURHEDRAFT_458542 [Aspergillus ruber CBS 135680]EYE94111.1 hypothetical protein EURHEDRAFT_458542 [Aspergillus ruber CBS 135680]
MDAMRDPHYAGMVASMPQNTFVEALHLLSPGYFIDPYREIHRPLHPSTVQAKGYKSLKSICDDFINNIAAIVQLRQSAGNYLGLAEYTHLLDCARSIGNAVVADRIWYGMKESEVHPDVQCYNYYMEAKVWDGAYTGREKYNLRMTPFAYRKRRFVDPNEGWQGYGAAGRSVRKEVLDIFNEMTEAGYQGNEATFVNVILACGRVGHLRGIKNVLKTAWNVNVDALLAEPDNSKLPPAMTYNPSSPLHPSSRLLFTVAHVLGTNNKIPAALRTIEFISHAYSLPVPERVWLELFERAFVLSRPRFGPDAKRNAKGKVPYDLLTGMFQTMTSTPYNVRPTVQIHHMLAKTAWDRDRLSEFLHHMRAAYNLLNETQQERKKARYIIEEYLCALHTRTNSMQRNETLQSSSLANAVHNYDILRLHTAQQTMIMERLARLLVINNRWTGRNNPVWERCLLPRAVEEWQDFLPESFVYHTRGGLVQFCGKTQWGEAYVNYHDRVPSQSRVTGDPGADGEVDGKEQREVDDDFFWERCRWAFSSVDFDNPPLNRLFWGCGAPRFGDAAGDAE